MKSVERALDLHGFACVHDRMFILDAYLQHGRFGGRSMREGAGFAGVCRPLRRGVGGRLC